VALFFLPNPVVVGMLAPSAGSILITVKSLAPGALGAETGQLQRVERGNLEEAGPGPIQHDRQQPAELFLH